MSRAAIALAAFIAGAAAAILAVYVALQGAPGVIPAADEIEALAVVADRSLSRFPAGAAVYVKSSVGPALLEGLQRRHPSLKLRPFTARPEDNGCASDQSPSAAPRCERDDFLKLEVLSSPAQRTMLVAFGTSNTFGQVLLLNLWGGWRVLVLRSYVV